MGLSILTNPFCSHDLLEDMIFDIIILVCDICEPSLGPFFWCVIITNSMDHLLLFFFICFCLPSATRSLCHYVPVGHGQSMISLRSQPQTLKMVARVAINTSIANLVFDDAYSPIDGHTNYLCLTLCRSSRFLNLAGYVRQFDQDAEFGRAFGRVVRSLILD